MNPPESRFAYPLADAVAKLGRVHELHRFFALNHLDIWLPEIRLTLSKAALTLGQ